MSNISAQRVKSVSLETLLDELSFYERQLAESHDPHSRSLAQFCISMLNDEISNRSSRGLSS